MSQFPNLNSLKLWAKTNDVKFLSGDESLPYVQKDSQFYYFAKNLLSFYDGRGKAVYSPSIMLVMVSSKDLGAQA